LRLDRNRLDVCGISLGSSAEIKDTKEYQGVPFAVGDTLVMKYSIIDNNIHANKYDSTEHNNIRSYLIKLDVTDNDENTGVLIDVNQAHNMCSCNDNHNNTVHNIDYQNCIKDSSCDNNIDSGDNDDVEITPENKNETTIIIDF